MPSSTADTARVKRPFQPSITSFFGRFHDASSPDHDSDRDREARSPSVPASVQANLISVGMRVRKSVPEGYKTHKTLPTTFSTPQKSWCRFENEASRGAGNSIDDMHAQENGFAAGGARELTPFCGLHKVGGMSEQAPSSFSFSFATSAVRPADAYSVFPTNNPTSNTQHLDLGQDYDFGFPASSQESNISNISTESMPARNPLSPSHGNRGNKRSYFADDDDDDDDGNYEGGDESWEWASSKTISNGLRGFAGIETNLSAFSVGSPAPVQYGRPIARPRNRRKGSANKVAAGQTTLNFVRVGESRNGDRDVDFEDAEFFQPMDEEVEMEL